MAMVAVSNQAQNRFEKSFLMLNLHFAQIRITNVMTASSFLSSHSHSQFLSSHNQSAL